MFKRMKTNAAVNSLAYVVVGAILAIYPGVAADLLCYVLGGFLLLCGAIDLVLFLRNRDGSVYSAIRLITGIVLCAVGIWVMFQPKLIFSVVPWIVGALIIVHAVQDLRSALQLKKNDDPHWGGALAVAMITLALGIILITAAFETAILAVRFIGIFLLVDGLSDLWLLFQVHKMNQVLIEEAAKSANVIDVEFTEVPDADKPAE